MVNLKGIVRFHRKQADLSQQELADIADVSRFVVQSVESGDKGVGWKNVCAILNVLNIKLEPKGPMVEAWLKTEERENDDEVS